MECQKLHLYYRQMWQFQQCFFAKKSPWPAAKPHTDPNSYNATPQQGALSARLGNMSSAWAKKTAVAKSSKHHGDMIK